MADVPPLTEDEAASVLLDGEGPLPPLVITLQIPSIAIYRDRPHYYGPGMDPLPPDLREVLIGGPDPTEALRARTIYSS